MFQGSSSLGHPAEHYDWPSPEAQIIAILPPGGFLLAGNNFLGHSWILAFSCGCALFLCWDSSDSFGSILHKAQDFSGSYFSRGAGLNSIGHYFHKYLSFVSIEVT